MCRRQCGDPDAEAFMLVSHRFAWCFNVRQVAQAVEVEDFSKAEEVYELQKLAEDVAGVTDRFALSDSYWISSQVKSAVCFMPRTPRHEFAGLSQGLRAG